MSHRLLSTIVFASGSLLACGGTVAPDLGTDAETPKNDAATPDAPLPVDSGPDLRACEPGWPTTKGVVCSFDGGIRCCDVDGGKTCCLDDQ